MVPPTICTTNNKDEGQSVGITLDSLHIDPAVFDKHIQSTSSADDHTADETFIDSPGSSYNQQVQDSDGDESNSADDSSDDETIQTNASARHLLKQAQKRIHKQSIYDEVKLLRTEVSQYRNSVEVTLRQKLSLMNKYNTLESELSQAIETIQSYKQKELQWNEERAQREKDFMNQMNDICSTMQSKEQELMGEIIARDQKIIEMQNQMNEEEMRRILTNEREKCDTTAHADIQLSEKLYIEDNEHHSWSDDEESCEFV